MESRAITTATTSVLEPASHSELSAHTNNLSGSRDRDRYTSLILKIRWITHITCLLEIRQGKAWSKLAGREVSQKWVGYWGNMTQAEALQRWVTSHKLFGCQHSSRYSKLDAHARLLVHYSWVIQWVPFRFEGKFGRDSSKISLSFQFCLLFT